MKSLLLDTHTLLWFLADDSQLSPTAKAAIENLDTVKFVSVASLWEISIKVSLGKLRLAAAFDEVFPAELVANSLELLPVQYPHLYRLLSLPYLHRDPFDRMLIAQSLENGLTLVTVDPLIQKYPVPTLW